MNNENNEKNNEKDPWLDAAQKGDGAWGEEGGDLDLTWRGGAAWNYEHAAGGHQDL